MVAAAQSITPCTARTVTAKTGYVLPTTVDQRTNLNDLPLALAVYHRENGKRVAIDVLTEIFDAMRDASACIVLYAHDGEITARCIWPQSITLTTKNGIVTRAYCTYRRQFRTFALGRVMQCHALTTPDDAE